MNAEPAVPIRQLTLYKHGVAFVQRQAVLDADHIDLRFRAGEVNDALKSLLVIDRQGGQVLGVRYATPPDSDSLLATSPLSLAPDHSLLDLLRGLRGWMVRLDTGSATERRELSGRLLGVELGEGDMPLRRVLVSLLEEQTGAVHSLPLQQVREVTLLEPRARQDLDFFLQGSRGDALHRTVTIGLSPGRHDLAISYLIPSPTWRVSYRLVAEAAAAEPDSPGALPAAQTGSLLLQGWGLFDNPFEEDLRDVAVTLTAGQPISFVYDLTTSRIPERSVVQDTVRTAAPVEFDAAMPEAAPAFAGKAVAEFAARRGGRQMAAAPAPMSVGSIQDLAQQSANAAVTSEAGELFQYNVVAPVSVQRGESALVPILSTQLPYRRELLFNEAKLSGHPVAALRFNNASGLVLERGPVTVVENGTYRGEAIVPFTRDGAELALAFAVELGIKVTPAHQRSSETAGIRIQGRLLHIKNASVLRTSYRIENTLEAEQDVLIEHPIMRGAELIETPQPAERTAEWYRWSVSCPARQATSFTVAERRYEWQRSELLDLPYARLQEYLSARWLDAPTMARIRSLLEERAAIARNEAELEKLRRERDGLYGRQEQLRANMAALGAEGEEGALRRQVVARLQSGEDRVVAIETRAGELEAENRRRETAIEAELASLKVEETP